MENKIEILYIDDEETNLLIFEINFREKYKVFVVDNEISGFEILEKNPNIRIVISDMKMPIINGIEFIKKVKEKFNDKKYFLLTGFEITNEIREALETGLILKYFKKPYNKLEIDNAIKELI